MEQSNQDSTSQDMSEDRSGLPEIVLKSFGEKLRATRNLSLLTTRAYVSDLRDIRAWIIRQNGTWAVNPDLTRYFKDVAESGRYRDTSVKRKIASVRAIMKYRAREPQSQAFQLDLSDFRYKTEERLPKVMTEAEFAGFLRTVYRSTRGWRSASTDRRRLEALRDRALFDVLLSTGVRIGEIAAANLTDVSIEAGTLLIHGKGRRQRIVHLTNPATLKVMRLYLRGRERFAVEHGDLFLNRAGRRITIHSIGNLFRKYRRRAGIERHLTPHAIRHSVATGLLRNGADIRVVQAILGHSSITMTQRYTHVDRPMVAAAMTKFSPRNSVIVS